jgi:hypothetical protein
MPFHAKKTDSVLHNDHNFIAVMRRAAHIVRDLPTAPGPAMV